MDFEEVRKFTTSFEDFSVCEFILAFRTNSARLDSCIWMIFRIIFQI
jgi:hypothetical protein